MNRLLRAYVLRFKDRDPAVTRPLQKGFLILSTGRLGQLRHMVGGKIHHACGPDFSMVDSSFSVRVLDGFDSEDRAAASGA